MGMETMAESDHDAVAFQDQVEAFQGEMADKLVCLEALRDLLDEFEVGPNGKLVPVTDRAARGLAKAFREFGISA